MPRQAFRTHLGYLGVVVEADAGEIERFAVHVGGEDLDPDGPRHPRALLVNEHGQRVGFLARRRPGDPDAEIFVGSHLG